MLHPVKGATQEEEEEKEGGGGGGGGELAAYLQYCRSQTSRNSLSRCDVCYVLVSSLHLHSSQVVPSFSILMQLKEFN